MSATKGFLSMSSEKRKCEKEKFEDCQKRLFRERIKRCGCTPQSVVPALQEETQVEKYFVISYFFLLRKRCAQLLVLTATSVTTRILHVLLLVKDSMLMFARSEGVLLDHNPWYHYRRLVTADKQKDKEALALLRKEYELYKDQWGLNLKYSREAGESTNYSKIIISRQNILFFSR